MTFSKWQESDVREMARTFMKKQESDVIKKSHWGMFKIHEKVSGKTTALSSLRTAQAGKSETRQNEKRYYKIQKGFICQ